MIIADTSALIALAACERLSLLEALFERVSVPPAVLRECRISGKPFADVLSAFLQEKVVTLDAHDPLIRAAGLAEGEREAMALYRKLHADRLLLDDARARRVARLNDIDVIGSIGILLLAKERGSIDRIVPSLESMRLAGIFLSSALIDEARRLAGE